LKQSAPCAANRILSVDHNNHVLIHCDFHHINKEQGKNIYKRNTEFRAPSNFCSPEAEIITYSERVTVTLVIQHVMRMRHIIMCGLSGTTIFLHITS